MKDIFFRSLQAEVVKAKNSFAFWLAWIGTSCVALSLFVILLFRVGETDEFASGNPWHALVNFYYGGTDFMLLPLFVIIIASLVTYMEHSNHMWKHLYTLHVSRWHLYISRLLLIVLLFTASHVYFVGLMLLSGVMVGVLQPASRLLSYFPDFWLIAGFASKTVLSILGLLALQYWVSMRFRSFIVPLGVGVIGFVMATMVVEQGGSWIIYIPYAYPLLYKQSHEFGMLGLVEMYSLLYFVLLTVLGYVNTRTMEVS